MPDPSIHRNQVELTPPRAIAQRTPCDKCHGTGRHRSLKMLVVAFLGLAWAALAIRTGRSDLPGTSLTSVFSHLWWLSGGVAEMLALYMTYRFLRGRCWSCGGAGGSYASKRLVPYLWRRDRERLGLDRCLRCGYDLTGNQSGRCPECGTICPGD